MFSLIESDDMMHKATLCSENYVFMTLLENVIKLLLCSPQKYIYDCHLVVEKHYFWDTELHSQNKSKSDNRK